MDSQNRMNNFQLISYMTARFWLLGLSLHLLFGCAAKAVDPQTIIVPDSIDGYWFTCEFQSFNSCTVLDDDGIYLGSD